MTRIREILRQAAFNPKEAGVLKVVASLDDSRYFEQRAIEEITEARCLVIGESNKEVIRELYLHRMITAIRMLALAVISES